MLVLKRKEGQWTEVVHRSGDVLRIRTEHCRAEPGAPARVNLVFDDSPRNFEIRRPERRVTTPVSTPGPESEGGFEPAHAQHSACDVTDHINRTVESYLALPANERS